MDNNRLIVNIPRENVVVSRKTRPQRLPNTSMTPNDHKDVFVVSAGAAAVLHWVEFSRSGPQHFAQSGKRAKLEHRSELSPLTKNNAAQRNLRERGVEKQQATALLPCEKNTDSAGSTR